MKRTATVYPTAADERIALRLADPATVFDQFATRCQSDAHRQTIGGCRDSGAECLCPCHDKDV
ncbi:MAG: hypothetical protein HOV92_12725 [Streptomyces sp.]|nr:hypothetical protein [Streptomyces sp.]